jgi:hypothetical protein
MLRVEKTTKTKNRSQIMSDSSKISIVCGELEIGFYARYQGSCCINAALAAAYTLYSNKPQSYVDIFTKNEFNVFYHDLIPKEDIRRAYADTNILIDLKKETIIISFFSFYKSMDNGETREHKSILLQILSECKPTKKLKAFAEEVASTTSILDLIWDEDCGEYKEEYDFLEDKIFKYPFSKLELLHTFFKDFLPDNQAHT